MSEAERKRRLEYKKNRLKWIWIQIGAIALVALILLGSAITYWRLNQTYYINYAEEGKADYRVQLKPNDFYKDEWLGKDQGYVSSLIRCVLAEFQYDLVMDADHVNYDYTYGIDAQLKVVDGYSGAEIYNPVYHLVEEKRFTQSSANNLQIRETVGVDYEYYDQIAKGFIEEYGLKDMISSLVVSMHVNVIGSCDAFEENSQNHYWVSIDIPLNVKTVDIEMTSTVPTGENRVLACESGMNENIFLVIAIVAGILGVLLAGGLIAYAYLTRNEDINYAIKVKRLVSSYRSYIQQLENEFDTTGYQILHIKTFQEMLGIRDTIQAPILMTENADRTRARFLIPTHTQVLYLFEIKVDDYDEIYPNQENDQ